MLTNLLLAVIVVEALICITCLVLYRKSKKSKEVIKVVEKIVEREVKNKPTVQVSSNSNNVEIDTELIRKIVLEFKSPLSLVVAPLRGVLRDINLDSELATKIKLAYKNTLEIESGCEILYEIGNNENYSDKLNVSQYNITSIVKEGVSKLQEIMNARGITLQIENGERIMTSWIDRPKIDFVIKNIVYNSVKQHQNGGVVKINLSSKNVSDSVAYCVITITDEAMLYYQSNISHKLIEHIIKAHGGEVLFENIEGKGNKVTISIMMGKSHLENKNNVSFVSADMKADATQNKAELPNFVNSNDKPIHVETKRPEAANEQGVENRTTEQSASQDDNINEDDVRVMKISEINNGNLEDTKKKLLVVDDNKDILTYLRVIFSSTYTVVYARNGQEGVDFALSEMPDLILCDVMMPVKDGFECCREIKENLSTCHIPIILLTARVEDNDVINGIKMGADDYIFKPFNPEILRVKVKNLIKNRLELKKNYMQLFMIPGEENNVENATKEKVVNKVEDNFIKMVSELIENNIHEADFGVKKLSEMLNMSQPTLYRKVKQSTGFTIIELIRGIRLKRAAILLKKRELSVQEVAERVGYSDVPTFRKNFVDFFNVTPSNYASQSPKNE